jgi:antitoxin VapB
VYTEAVMARTRIFKSGNSNAVRFPASFAVEPGMTVEVREEQGRWIVEAVPETLGKIDISKFAGSMPWLKPIPDEDRLFEERELDWDGKLLKRD